LHARTVQRLERGVGASPEFLKAIAAVFEIDFNLLGNMIVGQIPQNAASEDEKLALAVELRPDLTLLSA